MDNASKLKEQVKSEFAEYLSKHGHRKTPERFAILEHIYSDKGHFNMESLYESMSKSSLRVSRATLYNTMDILLDCALVVKHQFGENVSQYERAYGNENHNHLICKQCGDVKEYKNENLLIPTQQKKLQRFKVSYYSMYIYGICYKCQKSKQQDEKTNKISDNKNNPTKKK